MSESRWALLDSLHASATPIQDIPPALMSVMAERIEDAIGSGTRESILALSEQIQDLFGDIMRSAPEATIEAVRGNTPPDTPENIAFMLGQLNFAQMLSAQVGDRRAGQEFFDALESSRFHKYIDALAQGDLTGTELRSLIGQEPETISRNLKALRQLGITDWRQDGRNVVNFLTPAARAMVAGAKPVQHDEVGAIDRTIAVLLDGLKREQPQQLQKLQPLSRPQPEVIGA